MVRKLPPVKFDRKAKRPSQTIPDQSMSVLEIVKRYVRGIPVDVVRHPAVYVDQERFDLEKVGRMDFDQKAELAAELSRERERISAEVRARQEEAKRIDEERAAEKRESEPASGDSKKPPEAKT